MAGEKERVSAYQDTLSRMEPIAMVDRDAALASIAVSLKRIADSFDRCPLILSPVDEQKDEQDLEQEDEED